MCEPCKLSSMVNVFRLEKSYLSPKIIAVDISIGASKHLHAHLKDIQCLNLRQIKPHVVESLKP